MKKKVEMNKKGVYILIATLGLTIFFLLGKEIGLVEFPSILISTLVLIGGGLVVIHRFGLFSVHSFFLAFVLVPSMVPFLSVYLLRIPNFTLRGTAYSNPRIIQMGVFLVAIFVWIVIGVGLTGPRFKLQKNEIDRPTLSQYSFPSTYRSFFICAIIVVASAFLTSPGPTILTISYGSVLNNYIPWATFAGSLYMGSWIVLLFIARQSGKDPVKLSFYTITVVTMVWLLLHARRNEPLGVLLTMTVVYGNHIQLSTLTKSFKSFIYTFTYFVSLGIFVYIGATRSGSEIRLSELIIGTYPNVGKVVQLPGGGHNIFATYQFTLHYFQNESFLWGTTFLKYPIQSIPTPIMKLFSLKSPPAYYNLLGENFGLYHGGNYLLNEYFANFGVLGVIIAGLVFGFLVFKAQETVSRSGEPTLWTGFGAAFIMAIPRSVWYWQGNWVNVALGFFATYMVYLVVINLER